MGDMYKNCRWCYHYENGNCDCLTVDIEGYVDSIELVEEGLLDECVCEAVDSVPYDRIIKMIENECLTEKVGKKKSKEISDSIRTYIYEDFKDEIRNLVNNAIETMFINNSKKKPNG